MLIQFHIKPQNMRKPTPFKNKFWMFIPQVNYYLPAIIPLRPTELPPTAAAAPEFSIQGRGNGFLKLTLLESILFVVKVPQLPNLFNKVLVTYAWLPCGLINPSTNPSQLEIPTHHHEPTQTHPCYTSSAMRTAGRIFPTTPEAPHNSHTNSSISHRFYLLKMHAYSLQNMPSFCPIIKHDHHTGNIKIPYIHWGEIFTIQLFFLSFTLKPEHIFE